MDPAMVIQGREFLSTVCCRVCGRIPTAIKNFKTCTTCDAIVCKWCQIASDAELDEFVYDNELKQRGLEYRVLTDEEVEEMDKCVVCHKKYLMLPFDKKRVLKAVDKMRFKCSDSCNQRLQLDLSQPDSLSEQNDGKADSMFA